MFRVLGFRVYGAAVAGRLEDELTRQERENIALQARLMHLQSVAEDNRRLQQEVDQLNQVHSLCHRL